ncbi:wax ester/triacylglycerol synthase domain-containing protein [Mycolicibacterium xanthum]|uniref:wax ester/triacylglycerol synthase domain-containing protein n=1 Tax=Mycolicibacterium xanthum TaxID=2796469 RepID=UPI0027E03FC7|nr:wax ester/triacylglycerol synthase domain-containing protein [Mycolicibacterium xanthum]
MTESAGGRVDNLLSFTDQLLVLGQRATGQELVMQCVWVYDRAIDVAAVRRFHRNFGHGLMGRRVERSPLWFGRYRWVAAEGPACAIDFAVQKRPRSELSAWIEECAQQPVDPEQGPGWRLGVLEMTDGSTAVSLVMSHCLSDGLGALSTIAEAIEGQVHQLGYPVPHSRSRGRAMAADLRQTVRDVPELVRTLATTARVGFARRHEIARSKDPGSPVAPPVTGDAAADTNVVLPAVTVHVDLDEWDARAASLGGTSHALVAGFAAKISERIGRSRASDGAVTLQIPISDREPGDTRANVASLAYAVIDPTNVTSDLSGPRRAVKDALGAMRDTPDETLQLLPLTPFVPKWAVRRGSDVVFGLADLPVSCSNLGDVDPVVARVDGSDADYVMLRGVDRRVSRQFLERRRGLLTVLAGRIGGRISVTVVAYQPGGQLTRERLRALVADTLNEFGLVGVVDFTP